MNCITTILSILPRPSSRATTFPVAMHHLRHDGKRDIDLILERRDGAIVAIEMKAGTTVDRHDARHLLWLRDQLEPHDFRAGIVFHTGQFVRKIEDRVWAAPICAIWVEAAGFAVLGTRTEHLT